LRAAQAAVAAMRGVTGVIMPFPDGVVRSGSKPGSKYKSLMASTNDAYCPTLRGCVRGESEVPATAHCVLEIVIDGLDQAAVEQAMRVGMEAASAEGLARISAGNYGGDLGQYKIGLRQLLQPQAGPA
jgi:formylmethanofuran--tetrahydromethanopterin N-formyltransferase